MRCSSCRLVSSMVLRRALAKERGESVGELRMLQSVIDSRFEEAELAAAVVATPFEREREHALLRDQALNPVRELNLATCTRRHRTQVMEDARGQHIAPHDGKRRRRG